MFGSPRIKKDIVLEIYQNNRTVFRLNDIAMLCGETDFLSLNKKVNYYVSKGKLLNPRKGLYAKPNYNPEELACTIYTPSYISLDYVLQKSGVVFQYDPGITVVSYLSRRIEVDEQKYHFRKIKGEMLINMSGILRQNNHVNIASPERAFIDMLYLNGETWFDNLSLLNKELLYKILPSFQSQVLARRVLNIMG